VGSRRKELQATDIITEKRERASGIPGFGRETARKNAEVARADQGENGDGNGSGRCPVLWRVRVPSVLQQAR